MKPKIDLFVLNYRTEIIQECLDSFKNSLDKNSKLIIIDNGSTEESKKILDPYKYKKILIKENLGFGKGFNEGIKRSNSDAEWYCLISNDIICLNNNFLNKIRKTINENKDVGIIGVELSKDREKKEIFKTGGNLKLNGLTQSYVQYKDNGQKNIELDFVSAAIVFIKKELWEKLGGFDEIFYPYLSEETDLYLRAKKLNYKIIKNKSIIFQHKHSYSINKINDEYKGYISKKNSGTFKLIHYPKKWIILSLLLDYKSFLNIFLEKKNKKIILSKNIKQNAKIYFKALVGIIKNIPEIKKRRSRLS